VLPAKEKEQKPPGHQNDNYILADEVLLICEADDRLKNPCDWLQDHENSSWV